MKNIVRVFKLLWSSSQRKSMLVSLAGVLLMTPVAYLGLPAMYAFNVWNGMGAGCFAGFLTAEIIIVYYTEKRRADFDIWAKGHVRELMKGAIIERVESMVLADDESSPPAQATRQTKLN